MRFREIKNVRALNSWRKANPGIQPDLSYSIIVGARFREADLSKANLCAANLYEADLIRANLSEAILNKANLNYANLSGADLSGANLKGAWLHDALLREAHFKGANLSGAKLDGADLSDADLSGANLKGAFMDGAYLKNTNLREADLSGANLKEAILIRTKIEGAKLSNSRIYGISAWDLEINSKTKQDDLVITPEKDPVITVDNLEVAQFVYLLLNNEKIRDVINTIGERSVLILGRFTEERKAVLDALREKLRELGFIPMMFDFEKPTQRDFTETIKTLAGMSRFIIADITNPKSSPLELQATMPDYMIPFVPIIQENEKPFAMFQDLQQKYGNWVLKVLRYDSTENLLKVMDEAIVKPALEMADQLILKKTEGIRERHVKDFLK